ncbi:MAG TPA: hypothetical protein VFM46_13845, partial [Pseudomonadales bacterium]|nr:hypothetical protein [Pseudomonadales bacterium]
MSNLITGQIIDAYIKAWYDETDGQGDPPVYLQFEAQRKTQEQISHIQPFYTAIIDARINQTGLEPLLVRADMWANRYREAYTDAIAFIAAQNGGKLQWVYNPDKEHCDTCMSLNGIVAFATEWDAAGVRPQRAPNAALDCGGWQCGCELRPTTARRTRNAYDKIVGLRANG